MKKQNIIAALVIVIAITIITIFSWDESGTVIYQDTLIVDTLTSKEFDVISTVQVINQDSSIRFPTKFLPGRVKKKQIKDYKELTDYGFLLRINSKTNIPTPLIVEEKIYLSGGFGSKEYFCFDLNTGENIWTVGLSDDGPSTAVFSENTIYFNTESCTIFALDHLTGDSKWAYWLGDPLLTKPNISGDIVFTSYPFSPRLDSSKLSSWRLRPSHPLIGFDKKTGNIAWQKWLDGDIMTQATINDSIILAVTFPGTLYKIASKNGNILASITLQATALPTIKDQLIYLPKRSDDATGVKESIAILDYHTLGFIKAFNSTPAPYLDYEKQRNTELKKKATSLDIGNGFESTPEASGWQLASRNIGQSNVSSLQMFQGSQIKFKGDTLLTLKGNILYSILDEQILWIDTLSNNYLTLGGFAASPVLIHQDQIILVTVEGELKIYESNNGKVIHRISLDQEVRSKPIAKNNWIYIPTAKGELVCVDLNKIDRKTES